MSKSRAIDTELEKIRKETEKKAEAFYREYNIKSVQKKHNCDFDPQKEVVLYTIFSNKTINLL